MALDYDPGMENPLNAITDEVYDVTGNAGSVAVWPATDSCFFAESIDGNVYGSTTTNDPGEYTALELYKDYVLGPANLKVSGRVARWVHSYIVLLRPMNFVKWSYHGVGGPMDATLQAEIAAASPFDVTDPGIWINFQGQLATMDAVAIDQAVVGLTPIEVLSNKLEKIAAIMAGSTDQLHPTLQALFNQREAEWQVLQQQITDALTTIQAGADPRVNSLVALTGLPNNALADLGTGFSYIIDNSTIKAALLVVDGFLNLYRQHAATNGFWPIVAYDAGINFTATDLRKCIAHDVGGITVHFRYIGAVPYTTTGVWADEKEFFTSVWGDTKEITHGVDKEVLSEVMSLVRAQAAKLEDYHNWNRYLNEQNSVLLDLISRRLATFPIVVLERTVGTGATTISLVNANLDLDVSPWTTGVTVRSFGSPGFAYPQVSAPGNGQVVVDYYAGRKRRVLSLFDSSTLSTINTNTESFDVNRGIGTFVYDTSSINYNGDPTLPQDYGDIHPMDTFTYMDDTGLGFPVSISSCIVITRDNSGVYTVHYSLVKFTRLMVEIIVEDMFPSGIVRNYKMGICHDGLDNIYWLDAGSLHRYNIVDNVQSTVNLIPIVGNEDCRGAAPGHIAYDQSGYLVWITYPLALEVDDNVGVKFEKVVKIDIRDFNNPKVVWKVVIDDIPGTLADPVPDNMYSALIGPTGNLPNKFDPTLTGFHGGLGIDNDGDIFVSGNSVNVTSTKRGALLTVSKDGTVGQYNNVIREIPFFNIPVQPFYNLYTNAQIPTVMGPPVSIVGNKGAISFGLNALSGAVSSSIAPGRSVTTPIVSNYASIVVFSKYNSGEAWPSGGIKVDSNANKYVSLAGLYGPTGSPTRAGLPAPY